MHSSQAYLGLKLHQSADLTPILSDSRVQHPIQFYVVLPQNLCFIFDLGSHQTTDIGNWLPFSFGLDIGQIMNFRSLEEFWVFYMNQHTKPSTRRWHFMGTLVGILLLFCSFFFSWWLFFSAPLFAYGCAWYSHFFVEGNVPVSFGHPFWSLLCDFKMFGLMLTGKMDREIKRLGKRPVLQAY